MEAEQRITETVHNPLSDGPQAASVSVGSATPPTAQPSNGQRSKGGAPIGNTNRLMHGLHSHRLVLGKLTRRKLAGETDAERQSRRSLAKVEQQAAQFRAALEQAVTEVHGSISLTMACLVNTAARWERHAMLALRWLRERHDALDDAQRLAYSKSIAEASERRDRAITNLKLGIDAVNTIDAAFRIADELAAEQDQQPTLPADAPDDAAATANYELGPP